MASSASSLRVAFPRHGGTDRREQACPSSIESSETRASHLCKIFPRTFWRRGPLVDAIEELVVRPRPVSMNFGIEGSWGSGKTSILNELQRRLKRLGISTVRFDAWHYRQPERILGAYFRAIEKVIGISSGTGSKETLRRLRAALAPAVERRFGEALGRLRCQAANSTRKPHERLSERTSLA